MSAASGGRCAVVAAAVPEVGKDLKVCRPRMDALEARLLVAQQVGAWWMADNSKPVGPQGPK